MHDKIYNHTLVKEEKKREKSLWKEYHILRSNASNKCDGAREIVKWVENRHLRVSFWFLYNWLNN